MANLIRSRADKNVNFFKKFLNSFDSEVGAAAAQLKKTFYKQEPLLNSFHILKVMLIMVHIMFRLSVCEFWYY